MIRKSVRLLHLVLGLSSGLVILVVGLTGCILVFEHEIKAFTQSYLHVAVPAGGKFLAPSVLKAKAEIAIPGEKADGVLYGPPGRSAEVGFYNPDPAFYYVVNLNPYTGEVLNVWDEDEDFFEFVLDGHNNLWLPVDIGKPIVASATLIFIVMLISGLVLWWPKNRHAARQRFAIKWEAGWRRKNYDLHNVFGFYVFWIGMILAFTGLVWGFAWFSQGLYTVTGGKGPDGFFNPASDTTVVSKVKTPMESVDFAWSQLMKNFSSHRSIGKLTASIR